MQIGKGPAHGVPVASIFGDIRLAPRLGLPVEVTPHAGWRFGRLRIDGEDLPGLIGA